jgi:hypothetical protein
MVDAPATGVKFLTRISAKKVYGKVLPKRYTEGDNEGEIIPNQPNIPIMDVIGIAYDTKQGTSDFGAWTALTGRFKATNLKTGQVFASGQCFLPDIGLDMIAPMLRGDNAEAVEFAFRISAKADSTVAVGYTYEIETLMGAAENDPLVMLEQKMAGKLLAAPKPETNVTEMPEKKHAKK